MGFFVFVLGTAMGSFINVVVDRLIHGEGIGGRSHCDYCKKTLAWYDLIPLLSFVLLQGKCRRCHKKLSFQYPLVEFATGILYLGTWVMVPNPSVILYWGIVSSAWIIFLSDLRYKLISDYMQFSLFAFVLFQKILDKASFFSLIGDIVAGVMVALPIGLIYVVTNERAMGLGDVILASIIGFSLGVGKGLLALYIAFLVGAIVGVILLIQRKKGMKSAVP
ncbi:MAG: prepilin peptidase, partial [Candidatus Roizmanbacteria bacterium]|nr:prepilin peptidase [Candidatus Roizmanbacteria bacterium]